MIKRKIVLGKRFYTKDDEHLYPSVTEILSYYPKSDGFIDWLINNKEVSEKMKVDAGNKGYRIHKVIEETIVRGDTEINDLTEEERRSFKYFLDWWTDLTEKHNVEIIGNEVIILNEKDGYGGTIDIILKIDGQIWIMDFKTSNYIHNTHRLQLSAYKHAYDESAKLGLVHISSKKSTYAFHEVDDQYEVFLSVKKIYDFEKKNEKLL